METPILVALICSAAAIITGIGSVVIGVYNLRKIPSDIKKNISDAFNSDANGIKAIVDSATKLVEQYRTDFGNMRETIGSLTAKVEEKDSRIERLEVQIIERDKHIAKLEAQVSILTAQVIAVGGTPLGNLTITTK